MGMWRGLWPKQSKTKQTKTISRESFASGDKQVIFSHWGWTLITCKEGLLYSPCFPRGSLESLSLRMKPTQQWNWKTETKQTLDTLLGPWIQLCLTPTPTPWIFYDVSQFGVCSSLSALSALLLGIEWDFTEVAGIRKVTQVYSMTIWKLI